MTSSQETTRRDFLKTTVAAAAASTFAAPAFVRGQNLNSQLQFAGIGTDGKGYSDIKLIASHDKVKCVAFCDVDLARTEKVKPLAPEAPIYQDYKAMLDELGDKIDAVSVSTPDHTHAIISMDAMQRGKHVYCQKPLTRTVWEARQMRLQAKKSGVITRMGNQIHSHSAYRTGVKAIQDGVIGKVKAVHSWVGTTGHGRSGLLEPPKTNEAVPKTLDWNLWVSVAPMRPYGGNRVYHPFTWRDWQDFGSGAIGDFGCHLLDPVYTALKITGDPISVHSEHTGMNDEVWPAQETIKYIIPGTQYTAGRSLPINWYDGGRRPANGIAKLLPGQSLPGGGSIFVGEKGNMILPHVGMPFVNIEGVTIEPVEGLDHYHGWVDGCLSGKQPSDGFEYGGHLTEAVQLGNVAAYFPGETLEFDGKALKITNNSAANKYLTRDYRTGFEIASI
ncbi:MAG: Gfo/Idh/MocA family oxidoreductase [Gimesia chilikensis]